MVAKKQFICRHCGRRVFAEAGPLTAVQMCRSCLEKARSEQRNSTPPPASNS
jgi:DNA replicative helicase MCM subunit Mcm2 (Cdc46/Mcm family)